MSAVPATRPAARRGVLSLQRRRYAIAFLFVLPALLNFTIFRYVPIVLAARASVVIMVWREVRFSTIIFVAGLKNIPQMFYEAAAIDGAGRVRQFFTITVPLLRPVTLFVVVTQTISAFQVFVPTFVMTQGGPSFSTNALVYYIYQNGFAYNDMGFASAMSFVGLTILV